MSHDGRVELSGHREAQASCWTRDESDKPSRDTALAAGLEWLLHTEQPAEAVCYHHGAVIHTPGNRYFSFVPQGGVLQGGVAASTLVSVHVYKVDRDINTLAVRDPLEEAEAGEVARALGGLGVTVRQSWGADDFRAFALGEETHSSLRAAVERYHRGCPVHPSHGVRCECLWYRAGADLLKLPAVDEVGM